MFLFNKKKAKSEPPKEYPFILANSFRGFKKFHIVVHGNPTAEKNNALLFGEDLPGRPLVFREATTADGQAYMQVLLDGALIGAIFDTEQIRSITEGKIAQVYAKPEIQTVVGRGEVDNRHRIYLFVKYAEK